MYCKVFYNVWSNKIGMFLKITLHAKEKHKIHFSIKFNDKIYYI